MSEQDGGSDRRSAPGPSMRAIAGRQVNFDATPAPRSVEGSQDAHHPLATQVNAEEVTTYEEVRMSSGLMTDPRSLAEYERAVPGTGKRVIELFGEQTLKEQEHQHQIDRDEQKHRHEMERRAMNQGDRGQWMALFIAFCGFGLVAYLATIGYVIVGGIVFGIDVVSLVSVFMYGRKKQADETIAAVKEQPPRLPPAPTNALPAKS